MTKIRSVHIEVLADKVVCAKDVFTTDEYARVAEEIARLRPGIEPTYHENDVILYRASLDSLYPDRKSSYILQAIQAKLYSDELSEKLESLRDLAYTLYNKQHKFRTFLTEMRGDTDYRTHTDTGAAHDWTQIFMSWIWYYNPTPQAFSGGQLQVVDLDLTIEPTDNCLILLPAYLRHRIEPAVYSKEGCFRTTLNGFLSYVPPGTADASDAQIEQALANGNIVASHLLPEPAGSLGRVRQVTAVAMGSLEKAGLEIGDSPEHLRQGDEAFRARRFREAYDCYQRAYQAATA